MRQSQRVERQAGMRGMQVIRERLRIHLRKKRNRALFHKMRVSQRMQQARLLHVQQAEKQEQRQGTAEIHAHIQHFRKKTPS